MSEGACDVSLGDYDGDAAELYHEAIVTARTPKKCDECNETIEPKQRYERVSGKWDGEWSVWRSCLPCSEALTEFSENGRCFGVLWDGMRDNWEQGAHLQACLNRLTTTAAKEHMRRQWLKWKRLA